MGENRGFEPAMLPAVRIDKFPHAGCDMTDEVGSACNNPAAKHESIGSEHGEACRCRSRKRLGRDRIDEEGKTVTLRVGLIHFKRVERLSLLREGRKPGAGPSAFVERHTRSRSKASDTRIPTESKVRRDPPDGRSRGEGFRAAVDAADTMSSCRFDHDMADLDRPVVAA